MAYRDLRPYLAVLEKKGKLRRIRKEVNKDWEIAAVCRQLFYKIPDVRRPALMFQNVKGFSIPVVVGVLGGSMTIYAIGLQTDSIAGINRKWDAALEMAEGLLPNDSAVEGISRKWDRALEKQIAPVIVRDGPCKENVLMGDKVDILKLPVLIWTVGVDPAPFITSAYVITRDPETGVRNVGIYRM